MLRVAAPDPLSFACHAAGTTRWLVLIWTWCDVRCACTCAGCCTHGAGHVVLRDDNNDIELHTLSQAVFVEKGFIEKARAATPADYEHITTGFKSTIGEIIKEAKPHLNAQDWHSAATGLSRQQLLHVAVRVLLGQYRLALRSKARSAADSLSAITAKS